MNILSISNYEKIVQIVYDKLCRLSLAISDAFGMLPLLLHLIC